MEAAIFADGSPFFPERLPDRFKARAAPIAFLCFSETAGIKLTPSAGSTYPWQNPGSLPGK
jgi:hypothetical protein